MLHRCLFVIEPGMGHFHPIVPVIRTLQERGHTVALATSQLYQDRAERAGILFYPLGPHYSEERLAEFYPWVDRLPNAYLRVSYDFVRIFMASIPQRMPELERIVSTFQPTVVVTGSIAFAAQLFCERQTPQLPWAVLCPMTHFLSPGLTAPPAGYKRPAKDSLFEQLRCRSIVLGAYILMAPWRWTLNHYRRQLGLPTYANPLSPQVMAPYVLMHLSSREFDYNRDDLPPQVYHVGPSVWNQSSDHSLPHWLLDLPDNTPLIYVTLGTVFNKRPAVFRKIIKALGELNVYGVVATGPGCDPRLFDPLPSNVRVEPYIPQSLLADRPSVIVTHGGINTVMEALSRGIPLVCLPQGADQPDNAQRCVEAGAGLRIDAWRLTVPRLRAVLSAVLTQASFRHQAQHLQRSLLAHNGPEEAAELILRLAQTKVPILDTSSR